MINAIKIKDILNCLKFMYLCTFAMILNKLLIQELYNEIRENKEFLLFVKY